jgi:AraC-like DNA-binding protein
VTHARVARFEHELGSGARALRVAGPVVGAALVRELVGYRHAGVGFGAWLEPPRPEVTLMIALEGAISADGVALPDAWIGGLGERPTIVGVGDTFAAIDLKLDPVRACALLGDGVSALGGGCVDLRDACGRGAGEMLERLHECRDWDARFDVLEGWMAGRLRDAPGVDAAVARAFAVLVARGGRVRVEALAAELGCSRRYLSGRFGAQLGLSPKAVARQLRFAWVRRAIEARCAVARPVPWAQIAADGGYADQSHLVREFRALAGVSPTEYVARLIPQGGLVGDGL